MCDPRQAVPCPLSFTHLPTNLRGHTATFMWTNVNSPTLRCEREEGSLEALLSTFAKDAIYKQQVVQLLFLLISQILIPGRSKSVCAHACPRTMSSSGQEAASSLTPAVDPSSSKPSQILEGGFHKALVDTNVLSDTI